jgi:hypothetical protein
MDIDTGKYDKNGRRIYIAGSPFMYVRQMMKRAAHIKEGSPEDISADILAPLGVWKGAVEAIGNYDVFMKRKIAPPGSPLAEQVARRMVHAVGALTPMGTQIREGMRPGAQFGETVREILDEPSDWLRFLTYWKSHGLTYDTEVFTRLKRADKAMILNRMTSEARNGLIKGVSFGRIEGLAAIELKDMKDNLTYIRESARDQALQEVVRGNIQNAANILVQHGWSVDGARTFISTKGRKIGRFQGEPRGNE